MSDKKAALIAQNAQAEMEIHMEKYNLVLNDIYK